MKLTRAAINKGLAGLADSVIAKRLKQTVRPGDATMAPCHLCKEGQRLRPFEGIRVTETQATGRIENGALQAAELTLVERSCTCSQEQNTSSQLTQSGSKSPRGPVQGWPKRATFWKERLGGDLQLGKLVRSLRSPTRNC